MESTKKPYKDNKFKILAETWNDKIELPDKFYSVSDIQGYFEYIVKRNETWTDNAPIKIYVNEIENRITFKIKTGSCLELLVPEMLKLLKSTKIK